MAELSLEGQNPTRKSLSRLEQVRGGQLGVWREEVTAQAAVDAMDYQLDDWVRALDAALLTVVAQDAQSPRYRRYFSVAPWQIIRLGLESEIGRVRSWVDSLTTEPEPALQQLGERLRTIISDADAALERRRRAATTRTDHRVRAITALVDDINGARLSMYGALMQKAAELHLPRDWASRFFRHASRSPKAQQNSLPAALPAADAV